MPGKLGPEVLILVIFVSRVIFDEGICIINAGIGSIEIEDICVWNVYIKYTNIGNICDSAHKPSKSFI